MKRAVASTLVSRLYSQYSWEVLISIAESAEELENPLFNAREVKNRAEKVLLVLLTSNRGLCGAYNAQAIKRSLAYLKNENANADILTIGKKGDTAMRKIGKNIIASFAKLPDNINLKDALPISKMLIDEYTKGVYDKIVVVYTDFVSALSQKANLRQLIPVRKESLKEFIESVGENIKNTPEKKQEKLDYLFEGDKVKLIGMLAEKITRMQIYQMILESNASEQASRMVAIKNASDASGEMIDDLTLVFNKARQANITREISEISAGMANVN